VRGVPADRSRCQRQIVKLDEQLFRRLPQLQLDGGSHRFGRVGRRVFLQLLQLSRQLEPDQFGPCAEDLP
jgi:hypothetical protein